jgi:hypothetical protein
MQGSAFTVYVLETALLVTLNHLIRPNTGEPFFGPVFSSNGLYPRIPAVSVYMDG